jgi:transcription antitermination factor NusG
MGLDSLRWLPGAIDLVRFDNRAATVPDNVIAQLKERIRHYQLQTKYDTDKFERGDQVHVKSGVFQGYDGIFDLRLSGSQRVHILLEMLGRLVRTEINANSIVKRVRLDSIAAP